MGIVDTHAHIIDPIRFPFADGPGYKPRPEEAGTSDDFCAVLDAHDVAHALLVQPSGYGYDNRALLDAMRRNPGRFKAIAMLDPATPQRELDALSKSGVVGVRFNLISFQADALNGPVAERFLARLQERGWFAQIFADDAQWATAAPSLRRTGIKVLVDHFGVLDVTRGVEQPGFRAILALARDGHAAVKLSAPFRISRRQPDFADLDPFVNLLLAAFGIERCIWGSDWPFINLPGGFRYGAALRALERWLPSKEQSNAVLRSNPARLFGFGSNTP
jgi:predicted TIM-barrel fold metal-dependent hydrolase